jgi:hypothetical protein
MLAVKYFYQCKVETMTWATGTRVIGVYVQDGKSVDGETAVRRMVEEHVWGHSHDSEWHVDGFLSGTPLSTLSQVPD